MNRTEMLRQLNETEEWDIVIIGGGATGLGIAVDASSRGYKTLLLEQQDFAKGTSGRSTKLIHGGVRYLAMGNIKLVRESLKERGLLLKHAPHIVANISFVLPCYSIWQKIFYGTGLKLYDLMAGKWALGKTKMLSAKETKTLLPTLNAKKLKGGIAYKDGQFDDARLAINLAQTAAAYRAALINYCKVIDLVKNENKITAVKFHDAINDKIMEVRCKSVINATGVFTDDMLQLDNADAKKIIQPSQGIHLVFEKKYFPGKAALMIPKTSDGRVLFAVPWHNRVIAGTTDTEINKTETEPKPLPEEVDFIIQHLNEYLEIAVQHRDVCSSFAGLRPLVKTATGKKTAFMSRSHFIMVSSSGLVTITGGKWTTYRSMAEEAVNKAIFSANLEKHPCITGTLKIHGWKTETDHSDPLHIYGTDADRIRAIAEESENLKERIHPALPNIQAEVIWAVRHEMAMHVEDVLARRTRILFLDARAALEAAPLVATLMAKELKKEQNWVAQQIKDFTALAEQYLLF